VRVTGSVSVFNQRFQQLIQLLNNTSHFMSFGGRSCCWVSLIGKLDRSAFGKPIPVAARSNAWVCGRSLAVIAGSNPTGGGH
jgi:hypothetical protein